MGSNCDITIRQNHFAGMALFLIGGDKVRYFLDRSCTLATIKCLTVQVLQKMSRTSENLLLNLNKR